MAGGSACISFVLYWLASRTLDDGRDDGRRRVHRARARRLRRPLLRHVRLRRGPLGHRRQVGGGRGRPGNTGTVGARPPPAVPAAADRWRAFATRRWRPQRPSLARRWRCSGVEEATKRTRTRARLGHTSSSVVGVGVEQRRRAAALGVCGPPAARRTRRHERPLASCYCPSAALLLLLAAELRILFSFQ